MTTAATVAADGAAVKRDSHKCIAWRYGGQTTTPRAGSACSAPLVLACCGCDRRLTVDCNATAAGKCEACAAKYRDRVRLVAKVPHRLLLLTVTAPGRRRHYRNGAECACTPAGGVDLAEWNPTAGACWDRLWNDGVLRADGSRCVPCEAGGVRHYGRCRGCSLNVRYGGARPCLRPDTCDRALPWPCRRPQSCGVDLSALAAAYFRATEVQRRGALHFHVLLKVALTQVDSRMLDALRAMVVHYGFGHEVDLQAVDPVRAMHYVAKYVTKAAGERAQVPWSAEARVNEDYTADSVTGEVWLYRRRRATFRTWSASRAAGREWPQTMAYIRASQQHYADTVRVLPSWHEGAPPAGVAACALGRPAAPGAPPG